MKKRNYIILFFALLLFSCGNDTKNKSEEDGSKEILSAKSTDKQNEGQKTFGETSEEFLESLGGNAELQNEYIKKLKVIENMNTDSAAMSRALKLF